MANPQPFETVPVPKGIDTLRREKTALDGSPSNELLNEAAILLPADRFARLYFEFQSLDEEAKRIEQRKLEIKIEFCKAIGPCLYGLIESLGIAMRRTWISRVEYTVPPSTYRDSSFVKESSIKL